MSPQAGTHLLLLVPVNGGVSSDDRDKIVSNRFQRLVSKLKLGGVVLADRVVEGQFIVPQPQSASTFALVAQLLGQCYKLDDHLRSG